MKIHEATSENITKAAEIIKSGGLVSFPTETVYGLGADAFNPRAVAAIFEAKKRPSFDPLICHISRLEELTELAVSVDSRAKALMETFWPGPLTIVLPKTEKVPSIVTSGLDTVAVRMPRHPVALELIACSGRPVTAPSANPFGYVSPTSAEHVLEQLGGAIDMIIDGGPCAIGVESTIVKITGEEALLLRPGGISREELEALIGPLTQAASPGERPLAPGQLPFHYSPFTPVKIVDRNAELDFTDTQAAFLLFSDRGRNYPPERTAILSPGGNIREAASNLFAHLRQLDRLRLKIIYAEAVPETGLGLAIMDRLRKAAGRPD